MTLKEGLACWAREWRALKVWGRVLEEVEIEFRQRHAGDYATGVAYSYARRLVVTAPNMPQGLAALLHELAHLAAPGDEHHGERWRAIYVAAVEEVTGVRVATAGALDLVESATSAAVAQWWKSSGNEFAWSLVRDR